jgi:hypothetical protein
LDQPAATQQGLTNRTTEVRGYRVAGDIQAAAASFQQQFPAANGTRMIIDDRTQQLIVVATPEAHRAIAVRIQSGGLPLLRESGEVSAAQAPVGTVYQLRRLKWGELEEDLQRMWGQRLTITHTANGQQTNVALPGPDGPIPVMQIDRSQDRITFLGNYLSAITWSNLVQSLDTPTAAESVTQLVSLRNAEPVKVKDAKLFTDISYIDVLTKGLGVMDTTAISLCMDNKVPIVVFNMRTKGNIKRVIMGEKIGSRVF